MEQRQRTPIPRSILWSVMISYIASIAIGASSLLYANYVDRQSNQKWCSVLVPLDTPYTQAPPQSELGRKIAQAMHQLKIDFGC